MVIMFRFGNINYWLAKPNPDGSEGERGAGLYSKSQQMEASFPTDDALSAFLTDYQTWIETGGISDNNDFWTQFRTFVEKHAGTITYSNANPLPTVAGTVIQ